MVNPAFSDGRQAPGARPFTGATVASPSLSLTSFIGREKEIAAVTAHLRTPEVRLLTLTGPGGIGKTRIALRIIESLRADNGTEVHFVPLATLRDPDLVLPTVAQILGVPDATGGDLLQRIQAHLAERDVLFTLDNLEHIIDGAAPLVAGLLAGCPGLTVLATSRVRLNISGEHVFPVGPLSPKTARALFTARAMAADPSFASGTGSEPVIDTICARLDRLPLAIELAAARVPVLLPRALLARLDRRLDVLTDGPRDAPDRLRNMRETIAWSHDLLPEPGRVLFRRLGVFSGGFTLESAQEVAGEDHDVLSGISSLVTASLVIPVVGDSDEPRFTMFETIREDAMEQLALSDEMASTRQRHSRLMVRLAEKLWDTGEWTATEHNLQQLQPEIDNIRLALEWMLTREPVEALRLAGALHDFWVYFGYLREGWHWVTQAEAAAPDAPGWIRARALVATAHLAMERQDYERAEQAAEEAIAGSDGVLDENLDYKLMEIPRLVALHRGSFERSRRLFAEERERAEQSGAYMRVAVATMNLGQVALMAGDREGAEALLEEALALHQRHTTPIGVAFCRMYLGKAQIALGKDSQGFTNIRHAFGTYVDAGFLTIAAFCLNAMAEALVSSHPDVAVRLLGMAKTLPADINDRRTAENLTIQTRILEAARAALGEPAFQSALEGGSQLGWDDVRAMVAALPEPRFAPSLPMPRDSMHGLTPRELEVLRLVAAGHSNREIAASLYISVPTVKRHITTILGKLQVSSRSAATAYAHAYDLLTPGRIPQD